jgi:two-component system NtrC family sensor kinase
MTTLETIESRFLQEIECRKEAERQLEAQSLELYLKNQQLEASAGELHDRVELIGGIMDAVPDIIITCNDAYCIKTANNACASVLGYAQDEFVGASLVTFIPTILKYMRSLREEAFLISDIEMSKKDGSKIAVELRGRRAHAGDENLTVIVIRDISNLKASEKMKEEIYKQLHESRRLEAIGALASGIAHELNTPIQFIGDNVKFISVSLEKIHSSYKRYDRLKCECKELGLCSEAVDKIEELNQDIDLPILAKEIFTATQETIEGVKQVRDIVVLMKEFAHPGTGGMEPSDINRVVKGALTICRSRTKNVVTIETNYEQGTTVIPCRRAQIQQVLVNLIINAVEAIEEQGIENGAICIATKAAGRFFRIEICDNGPGIPQQLREKIFDPFFTTKQVGKGTGQGLALAKDIIVQQHRGRLRLEDRPGFSTSFIIELPCEQPKTENSREARHAQG